MHLSTQHRSTHSAAKARCSEALSTAALTAQREAAKHSAPQHSQRSAKAVRSSTQHRSTHSAARKQRVAAKQHTAQRVAAKHSAPQHSQRSAMQREAALTAQRESTQHRSTHSAGRSRRCKPLNSFAEGIVSRMSGIFKSSLFWMMMPYCNRYSTSPSQTFGSNMSGPESLPTSRMKLLN